MSKAYDVLEFLASQYATVSWCWVKDFRDWPPTRDRDILTRGLPEETYQDTRLCVVTLTQHPVRVVAPDVYVAVEACRWILEGEDE